MDKALMVPMKVLADYVDGYFIHLANVDWIKQYLPVSRKKGIQTCVDDI